jgi:hypothetical protein
MTTILETETKPDLSREIERVCEWMVQHIFHELAKDMSPLRRAIFLYGKDEERDARQDKYRELIRKIIRSGFSLLLLDGRRAYFRIVPGLAEITIGDATYRAYPLDIEQWERDHNEASPYDEKKMFKRWLESDLTNDRESVEPAS